MKKTRKEDYISYIIIWIIFLFTCWSLSLWLVHKEASETGFNHGFNQGLSVGINQTANEIIKALKDTGGLTIKDTGNNKTYFLIDYKLCIGESK